MFSLVPSNIQLSSSLSWNLAELRSFQVPVSRASDSLLAPVNSLSYLWRNGAGLTWQPLVMLTLGTDVQSTRDLRYYSDSTLIGRVAGASRRSLLGLDVGVERDRSLGTTFGLTPRIASWLHPRFLSSSSFILSRSLTGRDPVRAIDDSAGAFILPQTLKRMTVREATFAGDHLEILFGREPRASGPDGRS